MDKFLEREPSIPISFKDLDKQLSSHGLESQETLILRNKIKKFLAIHKSIISQELGTERFSIMVGGSLQVGTADQYSDIDLTIILDKGNVGEIWTKGGIGKTKEGIRGSFLFRQDSLSHQLQRDVEVNLLSLEIVLTQLEDLESLESEEDKIVVIDDIVKIFSPQLYEVVDVNDFRRMVVMKLTSISIGERIWNQRIVPQIREALIERIGDEKGENWPERKEREHIDSQYKNALTRKITDKFKKIQIPNFQEMRKLYRV